MAKDHMKLEFEGRDLPEVIEKMIAFLNMIKGINLGESEGKHDKGRETQFPPRPQG
jgi:hypothetical protein